MVQQNSPTKVWHCVKVSRVQSCMQCMGDTVGPPRAMCSAWLHWGALAWGASRRHWCLKSMNSGFARAKMPCLKNLDVLSPRIDAKK